MKRANGSGTICKLAGTRRRPYAVKITLGYTEEGKLRYKYLSYHRTRREAENALAKYNQDPYTLSKYTFGELYEEFYAIQEKTKAPKTLGNHRAAASHLKPLFDLNVSEIDRQSLQKFFLKLNVTPSIIHNIHRTLQGTIKYGVTLGVMPLNMLDILKVIDTTPAKKGREVKHTIIAKEEREKLWKRQDEDIVRVILFYLYTGLRYAELADLLPEDIHDDYLEIKQAKTEAGVRIVPICDKIKPLLPLPEMPKYTKFNELFQEVLPSHHIHDTRHTFVTMLTECEVDLRVIQSIVGHSRKANVTERYTHITLEKKLEAVNLIKV